LKKFRKGAMRKINCLFWTFFLPLNLFSNQIENPLNKLNYSEKIQERVNQGEIISYSVVEYQEDNKIQTFEVYGLGYHKRTCKVAMRKLSAYENFPNYLSIINKSTYEEKKNILNFQISPPILSNDIDVYIKIDRIKDHGNYPFQFVSGFFTALKGNIELNDYNNRCLFHVTASWSGPYSDIPSPILKLFLEVIIKTGMENLFRVSS
jgi:hypothetical protein